MTSCRIVHFFKTDYARYVRFFRWMEVESKLLLCSFKADVLRLRFFVAGNAEIISIGAFERLPPRRGLVIGVTYVIVSLITLLASSVIHQI